jgi:lysozyme family protein|tara:strand:+ start:183 stop:695 length:513 start_codon:yes stop_codon:yes gene_type:complete
VKDNFDKCLEMLLHHEGGFVNHPRDPGGITNLGVTKRVYEKWVGRIVSEQEMRDLTVEQVGPIYRNDYWNKCKCDDLPSGLDWSVFDWAVNSGPGRSAKALQGIIGATQDGGIGPQTLKLVEKHSPKEMIEKMHDKRQGFYEGLKTFDTFGKGWSRRNLETREKALELLA